MDAWYGHQRTARSISVSLVVHVVALLVLTIIWRQHEPESIDDFIHAELLTTADTDRPTLRRSRMRELQDSPSPVAATPTHAPLPTPQPRQILSAAPVPRLPYQNEPLLSEIVHEERLPGPNLDQGSGHVAQAQSQRRSPSPMLERNQRESPSQPIVEIAIRRDGVGDAMMSIADAVARDAVDGRVDVVFLLDASGSMDPHIEAVSNHLDEMAQAIQEKGVNARFGVVAFKRLGRENILQQWELTPQLDVLHKAMRSLQCEGDERALDVIRQVLAEYRMREASLASLVLVTDERLSGEIGFRETVLATQQKNVRIHVLGLRDAEHQALAQETHGLWFPLPKDYGSRTMFQ